MLDILIWFLLMSECLYERRLIIGGVNVVHVGWD